MVTEMPVALPSFTRVSEKSSDSIFFTVHCDASIPKLLARLAAASFKEASAITSTTNTPASPIVICDGKPTFSDLVTDAPMFKAAALVYPDCLSSVLFSPVEACM